MNIQQFIQTQLTSVDHLRALLLLNRSQGKEWALCDIATALYVPIKSAEAVLRRLTAGGLVVESGEPHRYRFGPASAEMGRLVEELVEMDRTRPVTLINTIYAARDIQAFAEAFRLNNKKREDT